MPVTDSPLRYPGGKTQLSPFVVDLLRENDLFYGAYVEPFAGGCGIAWKLLFNGFVSEIYINDIDRSIYSFWACALRHTDDLCERIATTPVTMEEWHRQKAIQSASRPKLLDLGFSTFFLNRTNRSGILKGGVIGGKGQKSIYPLDCRYNHEHLIAKVRRIGMHREQVRLTRLDAKEFILNHVRKLPLNSLVNVDPPYYRRGPELYCSFYEHEDHVRLGAAVSKIKQPWMVTYDDHPAIREIYKDFPIVSKPLRYSAQVKRVGFELMVLDPRLRHQPISEAA